MGKIKNDFTHPTFFRTGILLYFGEYVQQTKTIQEKIQLCIILPLQGEDNHTLVNPARWAGLRYISPSGWKTAK